MKNERKSGEREAVAILKVLGYEFAYENYDDNSEQSLPDCQFKDGSFLEITHTKLPHSLSMAKLKPNKFDRMPIETKYEKSLKARAVLEKLNTGQIDKKDRELLKSYFGYDAETGKTDSVNCDIRSLSFSVDNIIDVINIKNRKHIIKQGKINLFVFVSKDEMELLKDLLKQNGRNRVCGKFINTIMNSVFNEIFICEWDFDNQMYNTEKPPILHFIKDENKLILEHHQ